MHVEGYALPIKQEYYQSLDSFLKTSMALPIVEDMLIAGKDNVRSRMIWSILPDEVYYDNQLPERSELATLYEAAETFIRLQPRTTRLATVPSSRVAILKELYERMGFTAYFLGEGDPYLGSDYQIETVERLIGGQREYTRHMEEANKHAKEVQERIGRNRGNLGTFEDIPDRAAGKLLETVTLARCLNIRSPLFLLRGLSEEPFNVLAEIGIDRRSFLIMKEKITHLDVTNAIESGALRVD